MNPFPPGKKGIPTQEDQMSASVQASRDVDMDHRYTYMIQADEFGNRFMVPEASSPPDAMQKLQNSTLRMLAILRQQGFDV